MCSKTVLVVARFIHHVRSSLCLGIRLFSFLSSPSSLLLPLFSFLSSLSSLLLPLFSFLSSPSSLQLPLFNFLRLFSDEKHMLIEFLVKYSFTSHPQRISSMVEENCVFSSVISLNESIARFQERSSTVASRRFHRKFVIRQKFALKLSLVLQPNVCYRPIVSVQ